MIRSALTRLGAITPKDCIRLANGALNSLETGRWLRANGFTVPPRLRSREELHRQIAAPLAQSRVLYLEFGVADGASLDRWSRLLSNPQSHLYGFDSFEGLPDDWGKNCPKGTFSRNGSLPTFSDQRIRLVKGWFQETVPNFTLPDHHDILVLHLDADLYSSTICVLQSVRSAIVPGTILMFDEFADRHNELRAFDEFLRSTDYRFALVGATPALSQVAFRRI